MSAFSEFDVAKTELDAKIEDLRYEKTKLVNNFIDTSPLQPDDKVRVKMNGGTQDCFIVSVEPGSSEKTPFRYNCVNVLASGKPGKSRVDIYPNQGIEKL